MQLTSLVLLASTLGLAAAGTAYSNPNCGWGDKSYRAVGDWAQDAGSSSNWNPAEPKGLMIPTYRVDCEYQVVVRGLVANKGYQWKVVIDGENSGWNTNWGCTGYNGPNCNFQADSTGGITFTINAAYSYPLTTSPAPSTVVAKSSTVVTKSSTVAAPQTTAATPQTTAATPQTTATPAPAPSGNLNRKVFAHYMMGFAYGSDYAFFQNTIALAQSVGIDAFAVNVGGDTQQQENFATFLSAAKSKNFKLFISLDTTSITDNNMLTSWITRFAGDSGYYTLPDGRPYVSTFGGQDKGADFWRNWKNGLGRSVYFCPSFFGDFTQMYTSFDMIDCLFSWDSWGKDQSNSRDLAAISVAHNKGKQYMSGVSPWFYCHLPQWNKNWFWPQTYNDQTVADLGAQNIWATRWQQAIASQTDYVEIVTWNDFSESSYIAALSQEVPSFSTDYVNGMDHSAFLKMSSYYIPWFKTGAAPQLTKNSVYFWYRKHGRDQSRTDSAGKPNLYWNNPGDCVAVHAISGTTGGIVTITIAGVSTTMPITQRLQDTCVPFSPGQVRVSVQRNGQTYTGSVGPDIESSGNGYNFNVWTGSIDYPL